MASGGAIALTILLYSQQLQQQTQQATQQQAQQQQQQQQAGNEDVLWDTEVDDEAMHASVDTVIKVGDSELCLKYFVIQLSEQRLKKTFDKQYDDNNT